ncbi:glycosyltransferase [Mesorhizobium sp. ES1-1]|uniref:glycosyltransferase n=1 Tax=Mesorhizobium sp. ES1-1 TaxID=2876629 RepID=UPI001CCB1C09|nr:glycosyltransferase [Mesorhizobium sp. ES1-1]MBZ9678185.1 glycosyltransferase [Mesorhizobium sp. ES1-1]
MTSESMIRPILRRIRHAIPWRLQLKRWLRRTLGISPRREHLRAFAEFAGVFDAEWYLKAYPDVAARGVDPFADYMDTGWREKRMPADGVVIESYAAMIPGFRAGQDNPMSWLLKSSVLLNATRPRKQPASSPLRLPRNLDDGLCVTGYLCSEIGLGQAARNVVYACDAVPLPVSSRALALPERENDAEFASKCNSVVDRKAQLVVTDLAAIDLYRHEIAPGRLNILFPFWELARIPSEWHAGIRDFDEVWAPSRFIAAAIAAITGVRVHHVPQPVRIPARAPAPRADRSTLRFLTFFDYDSYVARKNPRAAIEAFRSAFPLLKRDVELVVKTRGARDEGVRKWLGETGMQDGRITIVDRTLDRAGMDALMKDCDAFISLHRSEGFGLGAAEALAAGKAVVATDYGGTTDFINESTGYPVAFTLVPVRDREYVHTKGQVWATANADAAVSAMRTIYDTPGEADARAQRGFALLEEQQSLPVIGKRIAHLLAERGVMPPQWRLRPDA